VRFAPRTHNASTIKSWFQNPCDVFIGILEWK
jgi:hypothetical protein